MTVDAHADQAAESSPVNNGDDVYASGNYLLRTDVMILIQIQFRCLCMIDGNFFFGNHGKTLLPFSIFDRSFLF